MKAHGLNPRIKKSPFFASSLKYGATEFHPYNNMWMPVGYDTPVNEYWRTIESATMWDVAVQKCVEISGPDAKEFVSLLTPRDISKVEPGKCRYIMMTHQDGGILNDPVMLCIEKDRYWLSTADSDMYLWSKGVAAFSNYDVKIDTPHVYPIQVQGPKSPEIAEQQSNLSLRAILMQSGDCCVATGLFPMVEVGCLARGFHCLARPKKLFVVLLKNP